LFLKEGFEGDSVVAQALKDAEARGMK